MAGLVAAIHVLLRYRIVKIVPIWIVGDHRPNPPRSGPMLDVMLTLNRVLNILKSLEIDEPLKTMALCKTFDESGAMLKNSTNEIVCHADVQMPFGRFVRR